MGQQLAASESCRTNSSLVEMFWDVLLRHFLKCWCNNCDSEMNWRPKIAVVSFSWYKCLPLNDGVANLVTLATMPRCTGWRNFWVSGLMAWMPGLKSAHASRESKRTLPLQRKKVWHESFHRFCDKSRKVFTPLSVTRYMVHYTKHARFYCFLRPPPKVLQVNFAATCTQSTNFSHYCTAVCFETKTLNSMNAGALWENSRLPFAILPWNL